MGSRLGQEGSPEDLIEACLLLGLEAVAACEAVIARLENDDFRAQVASFRADHQKHLEALHAIAAEYGVTPPRACDATEPLTTGSAALATLTGDAALLRAMSENESDGVSAYTFAADNAALPVIMRGLVETALTDERRHKAWMEKTVLRL